MFLLFSRIWSSTSSLKPFCPPSPNLSILPICISPIFQSNKLCITTVTYHADFSCCYLCFVCHLSHLTLMTIKHSQRYAWSEFHELDWQLTGAHTLRKEKQKGPPNTFACIFSSKLWFHLKIYTKVTYTKMCHSLEQKSHIENESCDWHVIHCLTTGQHIWAEYDPDTLPEIPLPGYTWVHKAVELLF